MTERHKTDKVEFAHPFSLAGVAGTYPPGTYDIETTEEMIDGLSFQAFRRVSTTMTPREIDPVTRTRQLVQINPDDMEDALSRDRQITASLRTQVTPPA